jgi:hypothetical protein
MKNEHYNMSFTTGGLFFRESIEIGFLTTKMSPLKLRKCTHLGHAYSGETDQ